MEIIYRIGRYFKPYWPLVLLSLVLNVSVSFVEGAMAIFVKPLFDEVFFGKNAAFLKWIPIILLSLILLKALFSFLHTYLMSHVCFKVVIKLRSEVYQHYLKMSLSQFDHTPVGTMTSRILTDVSGLQNTVPTAINLLRQLATLMVLSSVALYRDWLLTLIGLAIVPFTGIPVYFLGKTLKRNLKKSLKSMGNSTSIANEAFTGIRIIKIFGTENKEAEKFKNENENYFRIVMKNLFVGLWASPLTELITTIGVTAIFVIGGLHAIRGEITPGEFFSFIAAVILMYRPIRRISDINVLMQQLLGAGERVFSELDKIPAVPEKPDAQPLEPIKEEISFNNVWFKYPPPEKLVMDDQGEETVEFGVEQNWALKDISFKIKKGERVALVGSSGAGKSSIASLLPRFYDVTKGSITIDGIDIRDVTLSSLRGQMAIVTQETYLFNESVRNNIAYGLEREVSEEEIINSAKAANAHDFIMELPQGYDTNVGEKGVLLSGGQRQRLAIARAILRNAPILILDEATSNLDSEAEREVQQALEFLMKDRTTLVIAHRLSTIRNATRIIVLDKGEKVEEGSHEELIAKDGIYKYLYELQYFGEAGEAACG